MRQHQRYSIKCPGKFTMLAAGKTRTATLQVVELSISGFLAHASTELALRVWGEATIDLGNAEQSIVRAMAVGSRKASSRKADGKVFHAFMLQEPDAAWRKFVGALTGGVTHEDLENATRFMAE